MKTRNGFVNNRENTNIGSKMNKTLVIFRGVSGSGKSTAAKKYMRKFLADNPNGNSCICSADNFFTEDGAYKFVASKLGAAHADCRSRVASAMSSETNLVIVDNTSTRKREYKAYLDMAENSGYAVKEIVVGKFDDANLKVYANRNKHKVPLDTIRKQAKRFEK